MVTERVPKRGDIRGDIDIDMVRGQILAELEEPIEKRRTLADSLNELAGAFLILRKRGLSWEKIWSRLDRAGFEISRRHFLRIAPRIVGEAENLRQSKPVRKDVLKTEVEQKNPEKAGLRDLPARKKEPLPPPQAPEKSQYKSHFDLPEDTDL